MKKVIASLTLALAIGMFSESFAGNKPASGDSFATKVFVRDGSTKLDIFVESTENDPLMITFQDAEGRILAKEQVRNSKSGVRFDISDLKDGTYQVEITDGDTKQVESFELKSSFQRSLTLQ